MKIEEQKEFIRGLFDYKKSIDSEESLFMIKNFEKDLSKTLTKKLFDAEFEHPENLDIDLLFTIAEENGIEPMDYIDYIFQMFADMKEIELNGAKIDFSKSLEILKECKEQFVKHKNQEDIKNF